jgi:erythromycin esterase-like protein
MIGLIWAAALVACGCGDSPRHPDPAWITDVQSRAHPLASIDVSATDDTDLAFLTDVLEGRRIVELGENTHGAAQYSRAKTRIVKYLHEQLGFDVLVWETSILAAHLVDQELDGLTPEQATVNALLSIWHTEDVVELLAYAKSTRTTGHPLHLAGMDLMFSSADEAARRPRLLHGLIAPIDPGYADEILAMDTEFAARLANVWRTVFQSAETAQWEQANAAKLTTAYRDLADFIGAHQAAMETASPGDPQLPRILRQSALGTSAWFASFSPGQEYRVLRDAFMAEAFALVEGQLFPARKILVCTRPGPGAAAPAKTPATAMLARSLPSGTAPTSTWSHCSRTRATPPTGSARFTPSLRPRRGASRGSSTKPVPAWPSSTSPGRHQLRSGPGWTSRSCSATSDSRRSTPSPGSNWTACSGSRRSTRRCSSIPDTCPDAWPRSPFGADRGGP